MNVSEASEVLKETLQRQYVCLRGNNEIVEAINLALVVLDYISTGKLIHTSACKNCSHNVDYQSIED